MIQKVRTRLPNIDPTVTAEEWLEHFYMGVDTTVTTALQHVSDLFKVTAQDQLQIPVHQNIDRNTAWMDFASKPVNENQKKPTHVHSHATCAYRRREGNRNCANDETMRIEDMDKKRNNGQEEKYCACRTQILTM